MPKRLKNMLEIRQLTGMSQEELAILLDTSRSNVAMHETTGRGLPDKASIYLGYIVLEMLRPENQASIPTAALSTAGAEQLKKELIWLAAKKRFEAEKLRRNIEAHNLKETQRHNRQRLAACVEKAQATLLAQTRGSAWQPITDRHVKWLEMENASNSSHHFDEGAHLQQLKNQLRYQVLIKEAEEAEKLMSDIGSQI